MILYYSARDVYGDIFLQTLQFFTVLPIEKFSFEQDVQARLIVIDGQDIHPQRLKKITTYQPNAMIILLSDGEFKNTAITTQLGVSTPAHEVARLCDGLLGVHATSQQALFNTQEERLLNILERGVSNKYIARETGLALSTVKYHLQNIYAKLGVDNRMQAILKFKQTTL